MHDVGRTGSEAIDRDLVLRTRGHFNVPHGKRRSPRAEDLCARRVGVQPPPRKRPAVISRLASAPGECVDVVRRTFRPGGRAPRELDPVGERLGRGDPPRIRRGRLTLRVRLRVQFEADDRSANALPHPLRQEQVALARSQARPRHPVCHFRVDGVQRARAVQLVSRVLRADPVRQQHGDRIARRQRRDVERRLDCHSRGRLRPREPFRLARFRQSAQQGGLHLVLALGEPSSDIRPEPVIAQPFPFIGVRVHPPLLRADPAPAQRDPYPIGIGEDCRRSFDPRQERPGLHIGDCRCDRRRRRRRLDPQPHLRGDSLPVRRRRLPGHHPRRQRAVARRPGFPVVGQRAALHQLDAALALLRNPVDPHLRHRLAAAHDVPMHRNHPPRSARAVGALRDPHLQLNRSLSRHAHH